MIELLGVSCNDLVVKEAFTNPKIIPTPMHCMTAVPKIFRQQLKANDSISINRAFEPTTKSRVHSQDTKEAPAPTTPLATQTKRQLPQSPASACYGFQDQGVMIAAANQDLWEGGAACGKYFQVTCTGGTNQGTPHPCTDTPTVTVMITDFCPPPGCKGDLDLSHESFSKIADPRAGGIKISYQQV